MSLFLLLPIVSIGGEEGADPLHAGSILLLLGGLVLFLVPGYRMSVALQRRVGGGPAEPHQLRIAEYGIDEVFDELLSDWIYI